MEDQFQWQAGKCVKFICLAAKRGKICIELTFPLTTTMPP
jgi:hypothetical protein